MDKSERFIESLGVVSDYLGYIVMGAFFLIGLIAIVRVIIAAKKGKSIDVTPVGVMNDLPSSVTGIRKDK